MSFTTAPIRIGYCLSLTGPLAGNSQSARLAHEIWRSEINDAGGLLGRPVEFVCYDDEGDASRVSGLYERLLDKDRADLVIGGYGTNTILPAMPLIIERERYFVGLMGLGVNNALSYTNYFAMIPTGPDPNAALTEGFFEIAAQQKPRPMTVALLSADAVFSKNPILGARAYAEKHGFKVIHEAEYSLATTDFAPILDAVAASNCDLLFLCSYIQDSIDLIRAITLLPSEDGGRGYDRPSAYVRKDGTRSPAQRLGDELRVLGSGFDDDFPRRGSLPRHLSRARQGRRRRSSRALHGSAGLRSDESRREGDYLDRRARRPGFVEFHP